MALGGAILITVMWGTVPASAFAVWFAAILLNQAWRFQLVRRYRAAAPAESSSGRWGRASALGSALAGALWGCAGVMLFVPGDPGHQALVIVCLFAYPISKSLNAKVQDDLTERRRKYANAQATSS